MNLVKKICRHLCVLSFLGLIFSCSEDPLVQNLQESSLQATDDLRKRPDDKKDPEKIDKNVSIVKQWAELFTEVDRYAYGMRPNATARAIAYINLAGYETGISKSKSLRSESNRLEGLDILHSNSPHNLNLSLALNASYARMIDHFLINVDGDEKERISSLAQEILDTHQKGHSDQENEASVTWGEYIAEEVIAYSQTDFEAEAQILEPQPTSYVPPTGEGYWTFSADQERALFPYWGSVRTFVISSDETSSVPPEPYSNLAGSNYFQQMQEVYEANNSAKEEQGVDLWIAEFWSDDVEGLMVSPPGRQVSIAAQLIGQKKMSLDRTLEFLLKLGYALNDAAVSTWADKYEYMVMRPSVFIQDYIDPDYQTNLYRLIYWPNPTFPGYPSGHSTFASAAGGVFIDFFGDISFTDYTHDGRQEFLGSARSFQSLSEMAEENAFSRIPLGVHIRMDCTEGLRLGYEISDAVIQLNLKKHPQ